MSQLIEACHIEMYMSAHRSISYKFKNILFFSFKKNLVTNFFRYLSSSPTVPSSPTWNEKRVPLATLPQVTQQELFVDEKELELQVRILFY